MEPKKRTPPKPAAKAPAKPARTPRRTPGQAPVPPGAGGRTTLSLTKLERVALALRGGNYITTACAYAGIGEATFHKWRARGEAELDRVDSLPRVRVEAILAQFDGKDPNTIDPATGKHADKAHPAYMWAHCPKPFDKYEWPYVVFAHIAAIARAEAEVRAVTTILAAGSKSWQANAWWLERSFPDKYGAKQQLTLGGVEGGSPIKTENKTLVTVTELDDVLNQLIEKRKRTRPRRER